MFRHKIKPLRSFENEAISKIASDAINALIKRDVVRFKYPSLYDEEDVVQIFRTQLQQRKLQAIMVAECTWLLTLWVRARSIVSFLAPRASGRELPLLMVSKAGATGWRPVLKMRCAPSKLIELERDDPFPNFAVELIERMNILRTAGGLGKLDQNGRLTVAANRHSKDLSLRQDWSHTGTDGSTPLSRARQAGYANCRIAENTALGLANPEELIAAWMASPRHRCNILDDNIIHCGVSNIRVNALGQPVVVFLFGGGSTRPALAVLQAKLSAKLRSFLH